VLNIHGHIHNNPAPELSPQHVNVSIEVRDYHPWRLREILENFHHSADELKTA
jgi:calcineurin-like phosphoesterase family protein